jgi:hypothetical protein
MQRETIRIETNSAGLANALLASRYAEKLVNVCGFEFDGRNVGVTHSRSGSLVEFLGQLVAAPAWVGVGLPPVGMDVEVLFSSIDGSYAKAHVLAHDGDRALYRFVESPRIGDYQAYKQHDEFRGLWMFRPIRTTEEVEAEKRAETIKGLADLMRGQPASASAVAAYLYDKGVRLTQGVEV